jgi:glycosyltransferase involved in cell wall biosynthesis
MKLKKNSDKKKCSLGYPLNILLIYSRNHFEPESEVINSMMYTGTGYWGKWFYQSLSKLGEVDYVDLNTPKLILKSKKYDLIIGLNSKSFREAVYCNSQALKVLIGVNAHPIFRNEVLLGESKRYKINLTNEIVNPFRQVKNILLADRIMLTGNDEIANTYYRYGVVEKELTLIQGLPDISRFQNLNIERDGEKFKIIYPAGQIGLRKGILRFLEAWAKLEKEIKNISLTILGDVDSAILDTFNKKILPHKNIEIKGWATHSEYVELLNNHDMVVLLSLEEGQVFSVMEAMSCGCNPLISKYCGINLKEENTIIDTLNINEIVNKIKKIKQKKSNSRIDNIKEFEKIRLNNNFEKLQRVIRGIN